MSSDRTLKLINPLILAPMANLINSSVRRDFIDRGFGLACVGSIDARAVVSNNGRRLINLCGHRETIDPQERPPIIQLIGSDPSEMARAAELVAAKASVIDLNFGCPVPWVMQKGWGAALLLNLNKMNRIISEVVKNVQLPVTAKIRIASKLQTTLDIARCCQDSGAAGLVVHTRTPEQYFSGPANWDILSGIKKAINIPVIANGGVKSLRDVNLLLDSYHCDAVMIGTAAIKTPSFASFSERPYSLFSILQYRFLSFRLDKFVTYCHDNFSEDKNLKVSL